MSKRILNRAFAIALTFTMLWSGVSSVPVKAAEAAAAPEAAEGTVLLAEDASPEEFVHLNVGVTTPLSGNFFTGMWSKATSDEDIRALLHGYDLIRWNGQEGMFEPDPAVVKTINVMEDSKGDRTYIFTLMDDLYYSDGSRITAKDYAFSILFGISPEIAELGGVAEDRSFLQGYEAYVKGNAKALAGVKVPADDMLQITVGHEYFPFFYELGRLSCNPYPIGVIAPGVVVKDDGNGVYLANAEAGDPVYTAELLKKTVLDPAAGYMNHPAVVSGPYVMKSWDGTVAELTRNEYYKDYTGYTLQYTTAAGTEEKFIPYVESLSVCYVSAGDVVEKLQSGELDLVNKVTREDVVQDGMLLMRDQEEGEREYSMSNYPRTGLGYISFACEREELTENVRKALALCMDRDAVAKDYTGGFGLRVDGYYGVGQWMYGLVAGTLVPPVTPPEDETDEKAKAAYEEELAAWQAVNLDGLNDYAVSVEAAEDLLAADGWVLNEDTGILEKETEGRVIPLELSLAYAADLDIADSLQANWIANLEQAGIKLNLVPMEFGDMIRLYYDWDDRSESEVDMFFLATNFDVLFDPVVYFSAEEGEGPGWSYTKLEDKELFRLAEEMRSTEPGNVLEYMQKWVAFEERFNEILPVLPIYSNVYFDFYTADLHNYRIGENISWSDSIIDARYYRAPEAAEPEAETEEPAETEASGA